MAPTSPTSAENAAAAARGAAREAAREAALAADAVRVPHPQGQVPVRTDARRAGRGREAAPTFPGSAGNFWNFRGRSARVGVAMRRFRSPLGLCLALSLLIICILVLSVLWPGRHLALRASYLVYVWAPISVRRSPASIVSALEASGPIFIKLAQWLSTRRDVLSPELCDGMGQLHEKVQCTIRPPAELKKLEALVPGLEIHELLGGGCVAQVYGGELLRQDPETGDLESTQVAVKVRRDEVAALMDLDIRLLHIFAKGLQLLRPDLRWLAMDEAVENFARYMRQQLDLRMEAGHLARLAWDFRSGQLRGGSIFIPKVLASTESVMITERAPGVSLATFIKENHSDDVRHKAFVSLLDSMARMILVNGFIHGDLHPGNIFVSLSAPPAPGAWRRWRGTASQEVTLTLIDAGIAIELKGRLSNFAREAIVSAFRTDPKGLGRAVLHLHEQEGLTEFGTDLENLSNKVGYLLLAGAFLSKKAIWSQMFDTYQQYRSSRVSEYFSRMLSLLSAHHVRVSPSLWSLMTALALIEGSVAELGYGVNVLRAATPYLFPGWKQLPEHFYGWLRFQVADAINPKRGVRRAASSSPLAVAPPQQIPIEKKKK